MKVLTWSIWFVCFHITMRSLFWSWNVGLRCLGLGFKLVGKRSLARAVLQCWGLPISEVAALTIPINGFAASFKENPNQYSLRSLCHVSFHCPISICFLPCKPSSSFTDGGQKGAQWGLCSTVRIRWWCLQEHVNPCHGRHKQPYTTSLS